LLDNILFSMTSWDESFRKNLCTTEKGRF
jgi:hypothetical protein